MIGSILGVGIVNALLTGHEGLSGVDWSRATDIGYALLLSPVFGFMLAGLLLLAVKIAVRNPTLFAEPKGDQPRVVGPRHSDPYLHVGKFISRIQ
jgi:PiT family inorganic phosphate transporter